MPAVSAIDDPDHPERPPVFARLLDPRNIDLIPTWTLFVRPSLQKTRSAVGCGPDAAGRGIELVRAIGVHCARAKAAMDCIVGLGGLANGGRIEDIALRKFQAEGGTPASLSPYLNPRLRNGPQDSAFVPTRGDALQGLIHDAARAHQAALQTLLRAELAPTHFGERHQAGLLTISSFERIFVAPRRTFCYRDRYVPKLETTRARRLADNLARTPRLRSTLQGPVFID